MRHYPSDSPEAKARVVALALLADGAIDLNEIAALERHEVVARLGLAHPEFDRVVREFCEDMLVSANRLPSGQVELDEATIDALLDDIRDPLTRKRMLRAVLDIVNADGRLADGEAVLVSHAMQRWDLDLYDVANGARLRRMEGAPLVMPGAAY
ncbi:TerB family tellurite resistance protein [Niveibacterium sp. 24ML]|uniref:TerB family tellurite resistance protein n=1 Tax=Niveibacterium sp. 24ML TaxID=2985512 RepID=UPI002271C564|nr:TerB family tellurite resistance protein [Niveibacterium sp. 24ML]MCX9155416.1 TerB family tellurite resistance protein [Niveibacterium sp. 24ML]